MSRTSTKRGASGQGVEVAPERIRARAYEIFQARNGAPGDAVSDWLQAERELNREALGATADAKEESRTRARGEALLAQSE